MTPLLPGQFDHVTTPRPLDDDQLHLAYQTENDIDPGDDTPEGFEQWKHERGIE